MIGFTNDCTASIYVDGHYLTLAAATLALPLPTQVPSYEQCSQLIHIYMYMPVNVLPGLSIQLTLSLLLEIATCLVIDGDEASRYKIGCHTL